MLAHDLPEYFSLSACSVRVQQSHCERSQHTATNVTSLYITVKRLVSDGIVWWNVYTELLHSSYLHNVNYELFKMTCTVWNYGFTIYINIK
jgi:hypothetical protein